MCQPLSLFANLSLAWFLCPGKIEKQGIGHTQCKMVWDHCKQEQHKNKINKQKTRQSKDEHLSEKGKKNYSLI